MVLVGNDNLVHRSISNSGGVPGEQVLPSAWGHNAQAPLQDTADSASAQHLGSCEDLVPASRPDCSRGTCRLVGRQKRCTTPPFIVESINKWLKAQTDMLSVQAKAVAVQSLPPLAKFSGDKESGAEEDGFDKWFELFEERAKIAGWSQEYRLHQLKCIVRVQLY